ncbi:MAG: SCO family protein [Gammaproteobacteria bacterium]|nr:SCO family protein [Gammaproteobacteria bacterium]
MQLSPSTKLGLIAFLLVDIALAVILVSLFMVRAERELQTELRKIGATIYEEPFELSNINLLDQNGNRFSNEAFLGNWNLVFFGFTSCPDICPLTMAELDRFATNWLESNSGALPRIILATVDPETDTPQKMNEYLSDFNPDFIGLTGERNALAVFADELFVAFGEPAAVGAQPSGHNTHNNRLNPGDFVIDHSSHISVIDPDGNLFAVLRPPHRARDIAEAFTLIAN